MSLSLKKALAQAPKPKGKDFGRVGEGMYPARIVRVIDLGLQKKTDWKTGEIVEKDGKPIIQPNIWVDFEFPTERIEIDGEDRPRWVGAKYVVSNFEKANFYQLLTATQCGDALHKMLDKPVQVQVGSTKNGNDKIASVAPIMKGMEVGKLENPTVMYDADESGKDEVYQGLPQFLKDYIDDRVVLDKPEFDDDIPF